MQFFILMDRPRFQTPPLSTTSPNLHIRRHKAKDLTRSQRIRCRTLRFEAHWTYTDIARRLQFTERQARRACTEDTTPAHRSGRPLTLSPNQIDELIAFISGSRANRRMTFLYLATYPFAKWNVSEWVIGNALASRNYQRHIALGKPGLSEASRRKRCEFAEEHIHWTIKQWYSILWSDETWVNGYHRRIYVTRQPGEEFDDTCLFSRVQRRAGWMFWGCFSGTKKGPCLFWEKAWKSINSERYCEHTLSLVERYMAVHPYLLFMQDNAKAHSSKYTKSWLQEHQIQTIIWPPNSPDLNPIEMVWNKMKQWIQEKYGIEFDTIESLGKKMPYPRLREIVQEAWNQITEEDLNGLVKSMKDRCQAVINAQEGHTRY